MGTDHFKRPEGAQDVAILVVGPGAPARILSFLKHKLLSCKTRALKPHPSADSGDFVLHINPHTYAQQTESQKCQRYLSHSRS